jgi:hypothetical protein
MTPERLDRIEDMSSGSHHELTADLDEWRVTLTTGEVLVMRAHGVAEADGYFVFVALMRGSPHYEYELARIPANVVAELVGG